MYMHEGRESFIDQTPKNEKERTAHLLQDYPVWEPESLIFPNQRQQDNIMTACGESSKQEFLQKIRNREFSFEKIHRFISSIQGPLQQMRTPEQLDQFIGRLPLGKNKIIDNFIIFLSSDPETSLPLHAKASWDDVSNLVHKFPFPQQLEEELVYLLRGGSDYWKDALENQEFLGYLEVFMMVLYGKKYEYWQQWKLLYDEAQQLPAPKKTPTGPIEALDIPLETISDEERSAIIAKTQVHGDPYQGQRLTKEFLLERGLGPQYKMEVGGKTLWFSSCAYNLTHGRKAVIAYVEQNGIIVPRSYYLSNSQGVWRYLPEYRVQDGRISWYGKGFSEESVTLPAIVQQKLSHLVRNPHSVVDVGSNAEFIFAGTARCINYQLGQSNPSPVTYRHEVKEKPQKLNGLFYPRTKGEKVNPELMHFFELGAQQRPNIKQPSEEWTQKSSLYGDIYNAVVPSYDGSVQYLFCHTRKQDDFGKQQIDKVWIGGVEFTRSPVQSTGLRRDWIDGGDLTTPAYEYIVQSKGVGDFSDVKGDYVSMSPYVNKIPFVAEYRIYLEERITKTAVSLGQSFIKEHKKMAEQKMTRVQTVQDIEKMLQEMGGLYDAKNTYHQAKKVIEAVHGAVDGFGNYKTYLKEHFPELYGKVVEVRIKK